MCILVFTRVEHLRGIKIEPKILPAENNDNYEVQTHIYNIPLIPLKYNSFLGIGFDSEEEVVLCPPCQISPSLRQKTHGKEDDSLSIAFGIFFQFKQTLIKFKFCLAHDEHT